MAGNTIMELAWERVGGFVLGRDMIDGKLQFWPRWEMMISQDLGARSNFVTTHYCQGVVNNCLPDWSVSSQQIPL